MEAEISDEQKRKTNILFQKHIDTLAVKIDKMFAVLFLCQWVLGIIFAIFVSPKTWAGPVSQTHFHVYAAIFLGGITAGLPSYLVWNRAGAAINRFVITTAQIFFSMLFIHLTGGRIETHFHVFGSIAFLAFYRDWRLILLATAITGADHLIRGYFWPESVYGVLFSTPWRAFEHAAWVVFEDIFVLFSINNGLKELKFMSEKQASLEVALIQAKKSDNEANNIRTALNSFAIVATTNLKGEITYANNKFCEISKYNREELIGNTHRMINSEYHSKEFFKEMWLTIKAGNSWFGEIKNRAKDGSYYWVDSNIIPIKNECGEIIEYMAIRKDISERKALELEILELNKNLEKRVEEKTNQWLETEAKLVNASKMSTLGEMASGIAHEINNPLGVIKMVSSQLAEVVVDDPIDRELVKSMTASIEATTNRIAKIIQGMRAFSRDGNNDPFEQVQAKHLVLETVSFCESRFKGASIPLKVKDINESICFEGRRTQISQVILNLLNNAFDAISMDSSLKEKWVHVSVLEKSEYVEIRVMDSGLGLSAEVKKKLFQPFFTTKGIGKGTGIGLSISQGIVKSHHGSLFVEDDCPNTCFVIRLPKKQQEVVSAAA